jgi:predicted RNase H-like nuclease
VDTFVGFDSAWTDNEKAPGAIAAICLQDGRILAWYPPRLVSFDLALTFIKDVQSPDGATLIALDQPTIVENSTGMRPVERVAASLISWLGGGVQPSNTGRKRMFCAEAPIWRFLGGLGAIEDPGLARVAHSGVFLMEVFPALALPSLSSAFFGRLAAPRYNPANRRNFSLADWVRVNEAAACEGDGLSVSALSTWCRTNALLESPAKSDQDMLDAVLCTLIALRWRRRPRSESMLLGDLKSGYMVLPASGEVRSRLLVAAGRLGVPIDGIIAGP